MSEDINTPASFPYSTAKGFCQAAFAMMTNPIRFNIQNDITFALPFYTLIGFAVELYIKAFLISKGISEADLKHRPYGHNLRNLLDAAELKGFSCAEANALVAHLAPHESYEYRYVRPETELQLATLDSIFDLLSRLNTYVDIEIQASAKFGHKAGESWNFPSNTGHWRLK